MTICPTAVAQCTPTISRAAHSAGGIVLEWDKPAGVTGGFDIYHGTTAGVNAESSVISRTLAESGCASDSSCTHTIPYGGDFTADGTYHFRVEAIGAQGTANPNAGANPEAKFGLSAEARVVDGGRIAFTEGATSSAENRVCATLPTILNGEGDLTHDVMGLPDWLEHRTDNGQQLCVKLDADPLTVTTAPHIRLTYRSSESGGAMREATATITIQVNPLPPPAESSSSSGGAIALVAIAAGAYFWWKKRQIASGNAAKMALLPDVTFDLDRNDRRAFYTKMNWQNSGNSNWQLRGNANFHTKYSGKLLDWNANSHIGYRLNGKFGDFNPYLRGKFVANDPENAKMEETYTLGVNYAIPNRFSVQFLQPDDEIWRYSLKTQLHLSPRLGLNFARPNSDLPDYSLGLRYQTPRGFSVSVTQPNSELDNYSLGIQWRGASRIRYEFSGTTANNAIKLRGSFSF